MLREEYYMFKKDLTTELTEAELRLLKKAIAFTVVNDKELSEEYTKVLKILYDKVLFD
jgi:hypothetical protein